ncbi:MAG: hypothetical protein ACRDPJ_00215 [Nocardioidaceae bacterium]
MEPTAQRPVVPENAPSRSSVSPVDVVFGTSALAFGAATAFARRAGTVLEPVARVALSPPMLPPRLQPRQWLASLGRLGAERRTSSGQDLSRLLDILVPAVAEELLRRADLTTMVTRYVDLDGVVAEVDLDAAAERIDVNAVARRVDLDAAAAGIDVDAVARRLDLDAVLDRVDLNAIALRLDVDAILDRIDLTAVVLKRVDLDALVQAVLERVDLAALAEEVIDAVDLPEIIRESTGSMASDTVRGARMQGIAADEAVGRVRDRLLLRRGNRPSGSSEPGASQDRDGSAGIPTQGDRTR